MVPIAELRPHPKNRNKHGQDQVERLAKLLSAHGMRAPIVVSNLSGYIVKGHGTVLALKHAAETHAPVTYQDFESEEVEYQFLQADNAIASWAELDLKGIHLDLGELGPFDIELLGIKDFQFEPDPEKNPGDEDAVPEVEQNTAKVGDLFLLGEHRLLCGDSTDSGQVARLMNGDKADMLCWDPPWNVGFEYNSHDDSVDDEKYGKFLTDCLSNFHSVASPAYIAVVWQSEKNWRNFHVWFPAKARIVAVSKNFVSRAKHYLQRAWDPALMWHGTEYQYFQVPGHNQRDYFMSNTAATHNDGTGIRLSAGQHPCPRQVDAYEYFITGWTKTGQSVLDMCAGSGTALIACEKTNRKCYGMEIDPHYCDVILERWAKYTGKDPVREDGVKWSELKAGSPGVEPGTTDLS